MDETQETSRSVLDLDHFAPSLFRPERQSHRSPNIYLDSTAASKLSPTSIQTSPPAFDQLLSRLTTSLQLDLAYFGYTEMMLVARQTENRCGEPKEARMVRSVSFSQPKSSLALKQSARSCNELPRLFSTLLTPL